MIIAEKYAQQYMPNGEVSLADLIQAAIDESIASYVNYPEYRDKNEMQNKIKHLESELECAEIVLEHHLYKFPDSPTEFDCIGAMVAELVNRFHSSQEQFHAGNVILNQMSDKLKRDGAILISKGSPFSDRLISSTVMLEKKCKSCDNIHTVTDTDGIQWPCPECTPFDPEKL